MAFDVLNTLRQGRSSNNDYLSIEQIKFKLLGAISILLRQDFERNGKWPQSSEVNLGAVKLIEVSPTECGLPLKCNVLRTEKKIPSFVRFKEKEAYTFIGKPDRVTSISIISPLRVKWLLEDEQAPRVIMGMFIENYLYILNTLSLECVNIRGIFEDARDAKDFITEEGSCAYSDDEPYPVSQDLAARAIDFVLATIIKFIPLKNDETADTIQN